MLGIAAAAVRVNGHPITRWAPFLLPVAIAAAVLLEPTRGIYWLGQDQFGWHIAAFLFVVSVGALAPLRAIMAWHPIRVIGIASYSIYLMHQPLLGIFMGRMAWWYAVALMLVVCFAFWGLFERTVLISKVRRPLIAILAKPISRLLSVIGVPSDMQLRRTIETDGSETIGADAPFVVAMPLTAADAPNLLPIP